MSLIKRFLALGFLAAIMLFLTGSIILDSRGYTIASLLAGYQPGIPPAKSQELHGVWVQARSILTQEKIIETLGRVEAGNFNAIFVNVFLYGQTLYDSSLATKYRKVDPGFDPLAFLVPEAHRRNIKVHAWFVAGPVGDVDTSPVLSEHPDWGLIGPDGQKIGWLNFSRPDVRQFIADLMMETVERYQVDGLHFDYTRYPGPEWGFDPYSIQAFSNEFHFDLNELRYADLPAYGMFEGNPLVAPISAQVLATFTNGLPAVVLNRFGEGQVVLLNWNANQRNVAVGSEIMQRALRYMLGEGGQVYLLHSETNAQEYGYANFELGMAWLEDLGWTPSEVVEEDITDLATPSVLVLSNIYLISSKAATSLSNYVSRGGNVIFIDGPTRSIDQKKVQALTGMQSRDRHFKETMMMTATSTHPILPVSSRSVNLGIAQVWASRWMEFRQRGINYLIQEVFERVHEKYSGVAISVTITSDQEEAAQRYMQDWEAWLAGRYIDFLVPRGYVEQTQDLEAVLAAWVPVMHRQSHIVMGLKSFSKEADQEASKAPDDLLAEIRKSRQAGSDGIMIFDLEHMSDQQLKALASGPFKLPVLP